MCTYCNQNDIPPILFYAGIVGGIITTSKTIYKMYNRVFNEKEEQNQAKLIRLIENTSEQLNNNTKLINKILETKINNNEH
jgi:ribosomal protein S17E